MKGFFEKQNPSDYVKRYLEGKKNKDPKYTTENLKKVLFECATSDIDTDIYGSILILIELKMKRVYSTAFVDKLTKQYIKVIFSRAMLNPNHYNRYALFLRKYLSKIDAQIEYFNEHTGKVEQELMQSNHYYKLVESYNILKRIRVNIKEAYYHHCPEARPENTDEYERSWTKQLFFIYFFVFFRYNFKMTKRNDEIFKLLSTIIQDPKCELNFHNNFELLIAVMLSAQCTDKRVNLVTHNLFKKYKTPKDFSNLKQEELEKEIYSCGFYHNKAKNIISMSKDLIKKYNGNVPNNREELESLSGVGRKTANVVLNVGFNQNTIAVDTHVLRVSKRLQLTNSNNPLIVEQDLMKGFNEKDWGKLHHILILFGRYFCKSQNPKCEECALKKYCIKFKEK